MSIRQESQYDRYDYNRNPELFTSNARPSLLGTEVAGRAHRESL